MGDLRVTRPCPAQDYTRPAILAIAGALFCAVATSAAAFMDETRLLDLRAGTSLSERVRAYQSRGYELSDGTPVIFGDWYRSEWPDVQALFLTPLDDDLGFIWGFGTGEKGGGGKPDKGGGGTSFPVFPWMHSDVSLAWDAGYTGLGQTITFVDHFDSNIIAVNLDGGETEYMAHGNAVRAFSQFISPEATLVRYEYNASAPPTLGAGLDVINLSFGLRTESGLYEEDWLLNGGNEVYHLLEQEIIRLAWIDTSAANAEESAVIVKAAGNGDLLGNGGVIGAPNTGIGGFVDVLGHDLIGAPNVIFAGALTDNGNVRRNGSGTGVLARYSDHPGDNLATQAQFLVVGVNETETGTAGTSFAAPIISGYAAIVGHKFTTDSGQLTSGAVVSRLLETARTDTIRAYDPYFHGQGEASLSRAIAPNAISGN